MTNALVAANLPIPSPLGSLEAYMQAVHKYPMLSLEDEQRFARAYQDDDDLDGARQLVLSHLRFVVRVARGYSGYGLQIGDLIQEGNIGLMKAVKRFDPDRGVRLVSFAVHWIRAEMHEFILRNWRLVKVATTKSQRKLFFNLRRSKKRLGWMNAAEVEMVADELGVPARDVLEMESRLSGRDITFDAPVDDSEDARPSPEMFLVDEAVAADPYAVLESERAEEESSAALHRGLGSLDERSRDIIQRRWLTDGNKSTLQELADEYGVSAERIRQVEANAMKKMRGLFSAA